jgi:hypothetical protein
MHAMGGSSAELRRPTRVVAVDLARAGRPAERVELFVAEAPPRSRAAIVADLAELLESESRFVPVREPDAPGGARVALVGKRAILWIAIPRAAGSGEPGDGVPEEVAAESSEALSLFDHRQDVQVELPAGEAICGHVLYSSPADRPRLIDHLNLPGQFLRVWTAGALYLVNKHHVVRVLELS